jgi:regulator of protease activity HflC (stomatin/prohibitin superfamily)
VQTGILRSGLNVINPLLDVVDFDIRTQNYTMSSSQNEGDQFDDAIRVLSNDGSSYWFNSFIPRICCRRSKNFKEIGVSYKDKIVRPVTSTRIRDNAVYYDAVALYSTKRVEFQDRILKLFKLTLKQEDLFLSSCW